MRSNLSKTIFEVLVLSFSVLICFSAAQAYVYTDLGPAGTQSYTDAWNISPTNPNTNGVISYSPTIGNPGFGPGRTFGYSGSQGDANYNTIFSDVPDINYIQYITWATSQDITLYGVNLFASMDDNHDMSYNDYGRAIRTFSLYYSTDDGAHWNPIILNFQTNVTQFNAGTYTIDGSPVYMGMAAGFTFDQVTARYFRAEFTQVNFSGARVCELDAITTPPSQDVPEPATMLLLGFGLVGLFGIRRKMKK